MNAQGLSFVNDEEEALPTLDLSLPLPITPPRLPVELQEKLCQYYYWREAIYQNGEQALPSFLSDIETELKTKARQLGWIDWDKRREG
jgi:hypothetical protein